MKSKWIKKIEKSFNNIFLERLVLKKELIKLVLLEGAEEEITLPIALFFPDNKEEIIEMVNYCTKNRLPFLIQGNSLNYRERENFHELFILICMDRMDKIIFNEENMSIDAEAGVLYSNLLDYIHAKSFDIPIKPVEGQTVGDNVVKNAFSDSSFKYGTFSDYILSLDIVLGNGKLLRTGAHSSLQNIEHPIKNLFVGTRGIFGIIIGATLKIIPQHKKNMILSIGFMSMEIVLRFLSELYRGGYFPSNVQFIDKNGLEVLENLKIKKPGTEVLVIVEYEDSDEENLQRASRFTQKIISNFINSVTFLEEHTLEKEKERFLNLMKELEGTLSVRNFHYYDQTFSLPMGNIKSFLSDFNDIKNGFGIDIVICGCLSTGFIRVHMCNVGDESGFTWNLFKNKIFGETLNLVKKYHGTIVDFKGHNFIKESTLEKNEVDIFKALKKYFDPFSLLNSDKLI